MTETPADTRDTRQKILDAAIARILHYGYSKTTMSEIARDCDMSAGNIYRFFASKLDIAEAMARKFYAEVTEAHAAIARKEIPAPTRLRELFNFGLERTYQAIEDEAKILDVAEVLGDERPLVMNEQLAQERVYLIQILNDGVDAGVFRPLKNAEETAEFMQSGLMKFKFPQLFSMLSLPKLQRELEGTLDLILAGLSKNAVIPDR